jgi:SPP1 gp7 family putative phage head morphogenesis protein
VPLVTKARKIDPLLRGVASKFTKYEQQIYDIYVRAFSQMPKDLNNAVVLDNIRAAIASNNPSGGAVGLSWSNFVGALDKTVPTLANQLAASANLSAASLPKSIQIASSFTATDPRAIAWAQQRAGARILGITKESQKAVTETIARGLKGQLTRDEVVEGVGRVVGLDSRQARALGTFYEKNLNALLDQGLSYENAARAAKKLGEKYRERLIKQRATRIARTETNAAANAGRFLSWAEADLQGFLPTGSEKRWKTSQDERNCPTCRPMHDETVPWQGAFSTGDIMPPAHVNCLCTSVIVPAEAEFEKSLYAPIKKTRKNAWLFAKHGTHNQKTHGGKGGGGGGAVAYDSERAKELSGKMDEISAKQKKILEKYGVANGWVNRSNYKEKLPPEAAAEWIKLDEEWDSVAQERSLVMKEFLDDSITMKSGRSAYDSDHGFSDEKFLAVRDDWVVDNNGATLKTNAALRRTGRVTTKVQRFDSMVAEGEVKNPTSVYRAAILSPEQVGTLQVGTSYVDRGFQSVGHEIGDALGYGDDRAKDIVGEKVLFNYTLQTGLNAVDVGYGEILVQRGAKISITGVGKQGDYTVIDADVSKP